MQSEVRLCKGEMRQDREADCHQGANLSEANAPSIDLHWCVTAAGLRLWQVLHSTVRPHV